MRLLYLFSCLCLFSLSQQQPVGEPKHGDPALDEYLRQILEMLRGWMAGGYPDLGIPVLDPFDVPKFEIPHIEQDIIKADISIDNFVITNLSTFITEIAHLELEDLALELELRIPKLRGDAIYNLTGDILGLLPLYGDGPMYLEIYELDVYAKAAVLINEQGYVVIQSMTLSANFTDIKTHLDNLLGGGNFGESINNLLNLLGDFIWDALKDLLFPLLEDLLTKVINEALDGCSIADLIESGSCFRTNMQRIQQAYEESTNLELLEINAK